MWLNGAGAAISALLSDGKVICFSCQDHDEIQERLAKRSKHHDEDPDKDKDKGSWSMMMTRAKTSIKCKCKSRANV